MTNIAFYTTLSVPEVLGSEAVAVVSEKKNLKQLQFAINYIVNEDSFINS